MEVLFFALFFLVTIIFFVAGKDDFGRKEIKLKSEQKEEVKNELEDEPKAVSYTHLTLPTTR